MGIITNQVTLLGRVSKFNEIKYFETGGAVCTVGLGVKRGDKWHNFYIEFYNTQKANMGEIVSEELKEGDYIQVRGSLVENRFTPAEMEGQLDENGNQKTVSRLKINGYSFKRVVFNEELNEFEYKDNENG